MSTLDTILQYLESQEFAENMIGEVAGGAVYDALKPSIDKIKQVLTGMPVAEASIDAALEELLLEIATKTNQNINDLRADVHEALQQKGVKMRHVHFGNNFTYNFNGQTRSIPHRLTNLVPSSEAGIIGREKELKDTHRLLHTGKPAVLVNGIGGMGKTTLAGKYAVRYRHNYKHIAWLTVPSNIADAFTGNLILIQSLHLEAEVRQLIEGQNLQGAFQLVFKTLNDLAEQGKTLVVLDNANDLTDIIQYKRLFDTAHCHFLLTSRARPEEWQVVSVEPLPDDEALKLFRQHYDTIEADDQALSEVLKVLDYHTLLIELVAKSANASGIPFATLQGIIREKFIHDPELNKRKIPTGTHGDSLDDNAKRAKVEDYIWLIFQNVTRLLETQQELLQAFALLPPATVFTEDFLEDFSKHFPGLETDLLDRLSVLWEHGWLEKERLPGKAPGYKMHPLIADVVVRHLEVGVGFAGGYIEAVTTMIHYSNLNPEHNLVEKKEHQPLAERLCGLFWEENTEAFADLLTALGYLEENFGFYKRSALLKERDLQICEAIFEKGNSNIAVSQSNLAIVYRLLGEYTRARDLLEAALDFNLKNFGSEHEVVATTQSNLAVVYRYLGEHESARDLLEAALEFDLKNFGSDHPKVAIGQSNLANVYGDLGEHERARDLLEAALASDLKNFGPDHPNVAKRQNNLAHVFWDMGEKAKAKVLFQQAYKLWGEILGEQHPHTQAVKRSLDYVEQSK